MPSSSSHHTDDIHNCFHNTLLNITLNNFHIYLQQTLQIVSTYLHSTLHYITYVSSISYPVHMPSCSSCNTDDIHNCFHSTLLNITHNNFHIYLQHSLFCPHLLLYTAGSVLQYTLQVYHTVSN